MSLLPVTGDSECATSAYAVSSLCGLACEETACLIDDDAVAGDVLLPEGLEQAGGLIDAQHSGYGGDDELSLLLVPEQVPHHDDALLQQSPDYLFCTAPAMLLYSIYLTVS